MCYEESIYVSLDNDITDNISKLKAKIFQTSTYNKLETHENDMDIFHFAL